MLPYTICCFPLANFVSFFSYSCKYDDDDDVLYEWFALMADLVGFPLPPYQSDPPNRLPFACSKPNIYEKLIMGIYENTRLTKGRIEPHLNARNHMNAAHPLKLRIGHIFYNKIEGKVK